MRSIEDFEQSGFAVVPSLVDESVCSRLITHLGETDCQAGGARNLMHNAWCRRIAADLAEDERVRAVLSPGNIAVQCTLFEKTPENGWMVPYHQDLSIPIKNGNDNEGYRRSRKEGVCYIQPATAVLASLRAVRLHLDDCGHENGSLRVITGSHRKGRIPESDIPLVVAQGEEMLCTVNAGDALIMHPLLLHASSKPSVPSRRRVLHFLYGPVVAPPGLQWHEWCPQTSPS